MQRSSVDLPQPLGPTITITSPLPTEKEISFSTDGLLNVFRR